MNRVVKGAGWTAACVLALAAAAVVYVEVAGVPRYAPARVDFTVDVTPRRIERGRRLATMLCVNCHKDPGTEALTGRRLADLPAMFGEVYSTNITRDRTHGIG